MIKKGNFRSRIDARLSRWGCEDCPGTVRSKTPPRRIDQFSSPSCLGSHLAAVISQHPTKPVRHCNERFLVLTHFMLCSNLTMISSSFSKYYIPKCIQFYCVGFINDFAVIFLLLNGCFYCFILLSLC